MLPNELKVTEDFDRPSFNLEKCKNNKDGTNISTQGFTEHLTEESQKRDFTLSNLILNYEEFWNQKPCDMSKQNCSQNLLELNSKIVEDCPPSNVNCKYNFEKKNLKSSILCLESKKSIELGLMTDQEIPEMSIREESERDEEFEHKQSLQTMEKSIQQIQNKRYKIQEIEKRIRVIEQIALVGHWCSLYLAESNVRWQLTAILLYKEASKKLPSLIYALGGRESNQKISEGITNNLKSMIQNYQQNHSLTKQVSEILFSEGQKPHALSIILKESSKFVGDIMKKTPSPKTHQFCLFKTIKAISLMGSLESSSPLPTTEQINQQFSPQALKQNLLAYRKNLKNFSGCN